MITARPTQRVGGELGAVPGDQGVDPNEVGVLLVALGVIVNLSAVYRHFQLIQELSSGTWRPGRVSRDAVVLGLLLAAAGVAMAIYLTLVR